MKIHRESERDCARIQGIWRVRVWQLYRQYIYGGEIPELKKPERKRAVALERKIEKMHGIHIPHNRIYRILLEEGKVMKNRKKRIQIKYVRFWQGDRKQLDDGRCHLCVEEGL